MIVRKVPALGVMVVAASASLADLGIPSLSLAPATFCTIACPFAFSAAFSFAAACFAQTNAGGLSSSHLRHGCCKLLLYHGIHVCDGTLHGGDVKRVVGDEAGTHFLSLIVAEREAALFGRKKAPGSLTLPPSVAVPSWLAAAPSRYS